MLCLASDRDLILARFAPELAEGYVLRNIAGRAGRDGSLPLLLTNRGTDPTVLLAVDGSHAIAAHLPGAEADYAPFFAGLLGAPDDPSAPWPDAATRAEWLKSGARCLFLDTSPPEAHSAALAAGFLPNPEPHDSPPANAFAFTGQPRFSGQIAHSCRLGRGQELRELLMQGIHYDQEGRYVSLCLEHGPSFVCEVEGQAVSWSATHLNGSMGMIYTPPKLRRHGYARSLAGFQIDNMLRSRGVALAHVIEGNDPSRRMLEGLGARLLSGQVCWRTIYWG